MIQRVNDTKLEELTLECGSWIVVCWLTPDSIPCDHFKPEFKALQAACPDGWLFLDIDADEHPEYTVYWKVTAVPTTLLIREGKERLRFEGPYSREKMLQDVTALVKGKKRWKGKGES